MNSQAGYKLDLHTHSYGSPDGGLTLSDYQASLQATTLDYVAITDHNRVDTAQQLQAALGVLGDRIIIGEEITTSAGEIIGLYLTSQVESGLTPAETIRQIRLQGGLVYIPHPFETVRSGLAIEALDIIAADVDIIEAANGRAVFQNRGARARAWATEHKTAAAASSDAHGRAGWGRTYSVIQQPPTVQNLAAQLRLATYATRTVGLIGLTYPKFNRASKQFTGKGRV